MFFTAFVLAGCNGNNRANKSAEEETRNSVLSSEQIREGSFDELFKK